MSELFIVSGNRALIPGILVGLQNLILKLTLMSPRAAVSVNIYHWSVSLVNDDLHV